MTYKIAVDSESYEEGDIYLGINFSPVPPLPAIPLAFGVPANNLTGSFDSETLYRIDVPDGLASLRISIAGGTGDCDLYVRYGLRPSLTDYDFAPYLDGNDETVTITTPAPGYWYILLYGFGSYSGVSLLAQ
jgi:vibriolysin